MGHIRMGSAAKGRIWSRGSGSSARGALWRARGWQSPKSPGLQRQMTIVRPGNVQAKFFSANGSGGLMLPKQTQ
jgi:hypothetical protein